MLTLYYAFQNPQSEDAAVFLNTLKTEGLISAVPVSEVPADVSGVFLTDCPDLADAFTKEGGQVIWYENTDASHSFTEAVSDINELGSEDISEIICHLSELSHPAFSADGFTFVTLGYEDYKTLYRLQQKEPFLLPERLKNLSEAELHERYRNEHRYGRLHPLLHPYAITDSDGLLLGFVAVEQSDLLPEALNLSYYIVPQKRGLGLGERAVSAFLSRQKEAIGDAVLLAVIERNNVASVHLALACGFHFIREGHPLFRHTGNGFRIMQYKPD